MPTGEDLLERIRDGVKELSEASPEERKAVLGELLEWVRMGKDENGPLPLELGLRVPLPGIPGPGTAPDTSNDRSVGRRGLEAPVSGRTAAPYVAGVTQSTEPLGCTRGSDTHTFWRTGRDSNPRRSFPLARFPSACLQPLSHLSSGGAGSWAAVWSGQLIRGFLKSAQGL